jgi:hypothetical protein
MKVAVQGLDFMAHHLYIFFSYDATARYRALASSVKHFHFSYLI